MATQQAQDTYKNLKLMFTEGEHVICVRSITKAGVVWSGYYDDFKKLALFVGGEKEGWGWDADEIEATYMCSNPPDKSKIVITNSIVANARSLCAGGVAYRHNLLIDIDTIKHHGDVATPEEKTASGKVKDLVIEFLLDQGFPHPIVFTSGNGWHLIYRLGDIPTDAVHQSIIERVQRYLKQNFSVDDVCKIDVFKDANRMTRLYGTYNRKGTCPEGSEYWQSGVVEVPEVVESVSLEALKGVADLVSDLITHRKELVKGGNSSIEGWMIDECLEAFKAADKIDGYEETSDDVWSLFSCPWEDEHSDPPMSSTTVHVTLIDGIPGFNDLRASCQCDGETGQKRTWIDFRNACDPDRDLYAFPIEIEEDEELFAGIEDIDTTDVFPAEPTPEVLPSPVAPVEVPTPIPIPTPTPVARVLPVALEVETDSAIADLVMLMVTGGNYDTAVKQRGRLLEACNLMYASRNFVKSDKGKMVEQHIPFWETLEVILSYTAKMRKLPVGLSGVMDYFESLEDAAPLTAICFDCPKELVTLEDRSISPIDFDVAVERAITECCHDYHIYTLKKQVKILSITHNLGTDCSSEFDVYEARPTSPHDHVAGW
jgi:hypothetical protein